ncbi:hypothetical protein L596_016359 [Steinernema carpocapsae]|uniref:Uncharacterized protein n=1 Tax=Steinernema carpocapsae TaxID=34508 RepID=A0A4U5NIY1_STECR|nr:hypothetical protein L596_016359 [Steinernema carpocapsae]
METENKTNRIRGYRKDTVWLPCMGQRKCVDVPTDSTLMSVVLYVKKQINRVFVVTKLWLLCLFPRNKDKIPCLQQIPM